MKEWADVWYDAKLNELFLVGFFDYIAHDRIIEERQFNRFVFIGVL